MEIQTLIHEPSGLNTRISRLYQGCERDRKQNIDRSVNKDKKSFDTFSVPGDQTRVSLTIFITSWEQIDRISIN